MLTYTTEMRSGYAGEPATRAYLITYLKGRAVDRDNTLGTRRPAARIGGLHVLANVDTEERRQFEHRSLYRL